MVRRDGVPTTYHVNRDDVFSVSLVRWSYSVAYRLLAAGHLTWRGARERARSVIAFVENIVSVLFRFLNCQWAFVVVDRYIRSRGLLLAQCPAALRHRPIYAPWNDASKRAMAHDSCDVYTAEQ
jgi:hypothetical protein